MNALPIVEDFDVVEDTRPGFLARHVSLVMNQLGLEQGKEAFHRSTIITVSGAAHTDLDFISFKELLVVLACVLAARVPTGRRMMHKLANRAQGAPQSLAYGHLQSRPGQLIRHALGHRPTNDLTGEEVQHRCQIKPSFLSAYVGNVGQPHHVWLRHRKLLSQMVWNCQPAFMLTSRSLEAALPLGSQSVQTRQSRHSFSAARPALFLEYLLNLRAAIHSSARTVYGANLVQQPLVGLRPPTQRTITPSVVTAGSQSQTSTHNGHRIFASVRLNIFIFQFPGCAKTLSAPLL